MGSLSHTLKLAISSLQKSFTRQIQTFYLSKFQLDLLASEPLKNASTYSPQGQSSFFHNRKASSIQILSKLVQDNLNLCKATSICAGQPQSVQGNLNLCKTTSICAKQPQFMQNNLNSCTEKNPKSNGLFQEAKTIFRTRNFFSGQGIYIKNTFRKKNGGKASNLASAVAETVCPPCIRGRHPQLDYLTRP